ncbi:M23 family metallopeptidase [bacterium]|nr:M23 family metallopeptidase [bacterium]
MKRFIVFIIIFIHFSTLFPQTVLMWPTNASHILTSTFGEYRPGHFHSGIDIKTWGREGYPVYAVSSGYIARIAISPHGYGKVLYLKLDNGMTAVFAHLSRFCDRILPFVEEKQERQKRYSIFVNFHRNLIRVSKKDVIGYTGSTGIGYPHLHFELRDSLNLPVNPLFSLNSYISDLEPPQISSVAVIPLCSSARIYGDILPKIYKAEKAGKSLYTISEPIIARGAIGFSIKAFDYSEISQNKYSVFSYKLSVDGKNVFSAKYDTIPFQMTRFIDLDRNFYLRKNHYGLYNNLYVSYGKKLPFYKISNPGAGIILCGDGQKSDYNFYSIILKSGKHFFKIRAEDFSGNFSEVSGKIIVQNNNKTADYSLAADSSKTGNTNPEINMTLSHCIFNANLRFRLISSDVFENVPILTVMVNTWDFRYVRLIKKSPSEYFGIIPLDDIKDSYLYCTASAVFNDKVHTVSDSLGLFFVSRDKGGSVVSEDGVCSVSFSPGSFYTLCAASVEPADQAPYGFFIGKKYRINPYDEPLAKRALIRFSVPWMYSEDRKSAIYRLDGREKIFISRRFKKGSLSGYVSNLGTFAVLRDTIAPKIIKIVPADRSIIRRPIPAVYVKFVEDLSGIKGENSYKIYIDERRCIAEYDPENNRAKAVIRRYLKHGWHKLRIKITDRAGNASEVKRSFYITGRKNRIKK